MKKQKVHSESLEFEKQYESIIKKKVVKENTDGILIDWQNGENFEIFSLYKKVYSGATSADSLLMNNLYNNA